MTGKNQTERAALDRLTDVLVEDMLNAPDEEVLAEFAEEGGDAVQNAGRMRDLFEECLLAANKRRMRDAKAGVAAARNARIKPVPPSIDISEARAQLRALIEGPDVPAGLTLAARNEEELSDSDVLGMLEDLAELGIIPPKRSEGERS